MEITKPGVQSLQMKKQNAGLNLKGATAIYGWQPLASRLPELSQNLH